MALSMYHYIAKEWKRPYDGLHGELMKLGFLNGAGSPLYSGWRGPLD